MKFTNFFGRIIVAALLLSIAAVTSFAQESGNNYAQSIIDKMLKKHPEVATLAMHVTPPNTPDNVIIASNFGSIGKKADADDLSVLTNNAPRAEVGKNGDRFSVELPLRDVSGVTVGVLAVAYPYKKGQDQAKFTKMAEGIRDEIARRITNAGNLVEKYPYSEYPTDTYGQKLVDDTLAKHPDLQILAFHVKPPKGDNDIILASSIGRIGKKADEDDLKVIETGEPILEVHISGIRFEVELQLHDKNGKVIGAVSEVFAYKPGDDKMAFKARAEKIRAEIEKKIPSADKLSEPAK